MASDEMIFNDEDELLVHEDSIHETTQMTEEELAILQASKDAAQFVKDIQKEISTDLKFTRDKLINKFQLVSREEFEVLKKLVRKQELAIKKLSNKKSTKKAKKS